MARATTFHRRSPRERPHGRRWLAIVIVLTVIVAVIKLHSAVTGQSNPLDRAITTMTSPVVYVLVRIGEGIASLRYIFAIPAILGENKRLQAENTLLSREASEAARLVAENDRLMKLTKLKQDGNFNKISATILSRPYDLWLESALIGAGSGDGVEVGNLVANEYGIVGVISEVQAGYSRVELISSPQFRLGGIGGSGLAEGVLMGRTGHSMVFDKVSNKAKISIGEKIFSRGQTSVLVREISDGKAVVRTEGFDQPAGIYIGIVTGISKDESDFRQIAVEAAANPSNLGHVVVYTK